ncbi:hypothetical protein [Flexivirga meconopsidis]|uniref:hypothetical protein n=1 Tax=Flexivirga meconopsidis TaxID=2977121 RepID=UPI002240BB96|nr:hypothetical protein [Flexivirga meconopsidis]
MPVVTVKKKCCEDKPRCKKCPVTMHRLTKAGFAERLGGRRYALTGKPPRKVVKAARAR